MNTKGTSKWWVSLMLTSLIIPPAGFAAIKVDSNAASKTAQDSSARSLQLDSLFASLATSTTELQANRIAAQIWQIWSSHENLQANAMIQQVFALRNQGHIQQALALSNRLVVIVPAYSEGWNQRATLSFMLGDFAASLADIEQTLLREPRHFGALSGRAVIYMKLGKPEQAKQAVRAALKFHPFLSERRLLE